MIAKSIKCNNCKKVIYHNGKQGFVTCECKTCAIDYIQDYNKKWKHYIKIIAKPTEYIVIPVEEPQEE